MFPYSMFYINLALVPPITILLLFPISLVSALLPYLTLYLPGLTILYYKYLAPSALISIILFDYSDTYFS